MTAAITGFWSSQPDSNEFTVGRSQNEPGNSPAGLRSEAKSAPAQNARPAPVTMPIHAPSSAVKRANASFRPSRIAPSIALSFSARS